MIEMIETNRVVASMIVKAECRSYYINALLDHNPVSVLVVILRE